MDEIERFTAWAYAHPYLAGTFVVWLLLSALGHWTPSEALAKRYPRLIALVLVARDFGATIGRAGKPLAGLVVASVARDLTEQVYHPADKTGPLSGPVEPTTPRNAVPPPEAPRS